MKEITNTDKPQSVIPESIVEGKDKTKAEVFNEYFASVAPNMVSKLCTSSTDAHVGKPPQDQIGQFVFGAINDKTITGIIKGLKTKRSTGKYGFSNILIKQLKEGLAPPIRIIINEAIAQSKFPNQWKIAKVVPLYKKGDRDRVSNYRPISLLPSLSKIMEKVMVRQIVRYYEKRNLFPSRQYGFRRNRSTGHAIMDLVGRLEKLNARKKSYSLIFMDFSKAFDLIDHTILKTRLVNYGFQTAAVALIGDYLANRRQYVECDGETSSIKVLGGIGCPQGSCLGPLLYIMYTADMSRITNDSIALFFADDTSVIVESNGPEDLASKTEKELHKITEWVLANKLALNATKTVCYLIQRGRNKNPVKTLKVGNAVVQTTNANEPTKYLGVWIRPDLKWDKQLEVTLGKLNKGIGALQLGSKVLNHKNQKLVYSAFFESHVQYAAEVWVPSLNQKQMGKLEVLQKRAVRRIYNKRGNCHTGELFKQGQILKIRDRVALQCVKTLAQSWALTNKRLNATDIYKWGIEGPELLTEVVTFRESISRTGIVMKFGTGPTTKRTLAYTETFAKYKMKIVNNGIKIETRINDIKKKMYENYMTNCLKENCFACKLN